MNRKFVIPILAASAVALALAVGWVSSRPQLPVGRLSDGSTVALKKITCGTRHVYSLSPFWPAAMMAHLPPRLARRLPIKGVFYQSDTNVMVIGLLRKPSPSGGVRPLTLAVVDDIGNPWQQSSVFQNTFGLLMLDRRVLRSYPRRAKNLTLQLTETLPDQRARTVVEWTVPNPDRRVYPQWESAAPPVTQSFGDSRFSLVELKAFHGTNGFNTRLRFQVTDPRQSNPGWRLDEVMSMSDATGNILIPRNGALQTLGYEGPGALDWRETTWKVEAVFCDAEPVLWRLHLSITNGPFRCQTNFWGQEFSLQFSPNRARIDPAILTLTPAYGLKQSRVVLHTMIDNRQRLLPKGAGYVAFEANTYFWLAPILPETASITVTFGLQRRQEMTFYAQPSGAE